MKRAIIPYPARDAESVWAMGYRLKTYQWRSIRSALQHLRNCRDCRTRGFCPTGEYLIDTWTDPGSKEN